MADNLLAVVSFAVALASLVLVRPAIRPRAGSLHGHPGLLGEVFATVMVAPILARYMAIPALHWLSVRLL